MEGLNIQSPISYLHSTPPVKAIRNGDFPQIVRTRSRGVGVVTSPTMPTHREFASLKIFWVFGNDDKKHFFGVLIV